MTLPSESIYAKLGRGIAGQDTLEISNLHNKILISALTTVAAGESNKIVLEYSLPGEIIEIGNDHLKYQLRIPKQPGVLKKNGHVEIIYPQGYQIGNTNLPYYQVLENGKMIYNIPSLKKNGVPFTSGDMIIPEATSVELTTFEFNFQGYILDLTGKDSNQKKHSYY